MVLRKKHQSRFGLRCICVGLLAIVLNACQKPSCQQCLTQPPPFPSNKLKLQQKSPPVFERRNYDLCLLKNAGVLIIRKGQTWTFVMPSDALFENDTDVIESEYQRVLNTIADFMKTYPKILVTVKAYTDKPSDEVVTKSGPFSEELTQRQADAIVADLTASHINARLIVGEGMGAKHPVAWDGSEKGRMLNRRVEIHFRYYRDNTAWF